jgi:hypothetical protein
MDDAGDPMKNPWAEAMMDGNLAFYGMLEKCIDCKEKCKQYKARQGRVFCRKDGEVFAEASRRVETELATVKVEKREWPLGGLPEGCDADKKRAM